MCIAEVMVEKNPRREKRKNDGRVKMSIVDVRCRFDARCEAVQCPV
jgi:hypothetical protein